MISITIIHHSVVSLESIYLSSQKSNQGSKKRKIIRISLRIHPAHFPTAGLTVNTLKRGKRVVVVIAEIRKSEAHFFSASHAISLGTEIE